MQVTTALLADAARVEGGKLYVHGGGWDTIYAASLPMTHPTMTLAVVFRVEYTEALEDIPFTIELVSEDGEQVHPNVEGVMNIGHPPGQIRGAATFVPQTFTFNLLSFAKVGGFQFRVTAAGETLATVPFRVVLQQGQTR